MWVEAIVFFLGVALLFYCLLAGADFGAGILEAFSPPRKQAMIEKLVTRAIGPVWESNHIWMILIVVILFNGFPRAFAQLSITFHLPLLLLLAGIVLRGSAFSFRHYDVVDGRKRPFHSAVFSAVFSFSSFLAPLAMGLVAGGMILGRVKPHARGYANLYIHPWWNPFCVALGIFICCLFSFTAAAYLIGETADVELRKMMAVRAKIAICLAVLSGGFVLCFAWLESSEWVYAFLHFSASGSCIVLATLLLYPAWTSLLRPRSWVPRALVASLMSLVLFGWFGAEFPVLIRTHPDSLIDPYSFYNCAAPVSTLKYLFWSLVSGTALVFPALFYLFNVFKRVE